MVVLEDRLNTLFAENGDLSAVAEDEVTTLRQRAEHLESVNQRLRDSLVEAAKQVVQQASLIRSLRVQIAAANEQRKTVTELIRDEILDLNKKVSFGIRMTLLFGSRLYR